MTASPISSSISREAPAVQVEELGIRYGRRQVLTGVAFAVTPGSVYALLGRNGSGKTSIVRCLLGEQRPSAGRVALLGREPWAARAGLMRRVGAVPEVPDVPPAMTARQALRFVGSFHPRWDGTGAEKRLQGFEVPLDLPFGRLSRGQKELVSLALALGHEPELLILDDPTLGLDAVVREAVLGEIIGELADRGTTVLVTSHDLVGMEGLADRVGMLGEGRLVVDEPLEALKTRVRRLTWPAGAPKDEAALVGLAPLGDTRRSWGREIVVTAFDEARWAELGAAGGAPTAEPMTLPEIFIALLGAGSAPGDSGADSGKETP